MNTSLSDQPQMTHVDDIEVTEPMLIAGIGAARIVGWPPCETHHQFKLFAESLRAVYRAMRAAEPPRESDFDWAALQQIRKESS